MAPAGTGHRFQAFACGAPRGSLRWGSRRFSGEGCPDGEAANHLRAYDFKVGANRLLFSLSGTGWLEVDGRTVNEDLLRRLTSNPVLGSFVGLLNGGLALLVWQLFRKRSDSSVKPEKRRWSRSRFGRGSRRRE